jgi:hypothetical protein
VSHGWLCAGLLRGAHRDGRGTRAGFARGGGSGAGPGGGQVRERPGSREEVGGLATPFGAPLFGFFPSWRPPKKTRKKRRVHPIGVISARLPCVLFEELGARCGVPARKVGDLAMKHPDVVTRLSHSQRSQRQVWARRPRSPGRKKSSRPEVFSAPHALPRPRSAALRRLRARAGTTEIISNLRADHPFQGSRSATQHSISLFQPQRAKGPREVVDLSPLQDDDSAPGLSISTRRGGGLVEEGGKVAETVL